MVAVRLDAMAEPAASEVNAIIRPEIPTRAWSRCGARAAAPR
jgi:hypothetical protein